MRGARGNFSHNRVIHLGQLTENSDALWDDGVAPELALDFDAPNISSQRALWTTLSVLTGFATFYQILKATTPTEGNPALNHSTDCVVPDYSFLENTTSFLENKTPTKK